MSSLIYYIQALCQDNGLNLYNLLHGWKGGKAAERNKRLRCGVLFYPETRQGKDKSMPTATATATTATWPIETSDAKVELFNQPPKRPIWTREPDGNGNDIIVAERLPLKKPRKFVTARKAK